MILPISPDFDFVTSARPFPLQETARTAICRFLSDSAAGAATRPILPEHGCRPRSMKDRRGIISSACAWPSHVLTERATDNATEKSVDIVLFRRSLAVR